MSRALRHIRTAKAVIAPLRNMLDNLSDALDRAQRDLQAERSTGHLSPLQTPVEGLPEPTEHRRLHRPGVPSKLDTDPELRAFVLARMDRMTFPQLADAVAAHFPPERRVRKSAIHRWWRKNHPE